MSRNILGHLNRNINPSIRIAKDHYSLEKKKSYFCNVPINYKLICPPDNSSFQFPKNDKTVSQLKKVLLRMNTNIVLKITDGKVNLPHTR